MHQLAAAAEEDVQHIIKFIYIDKNGSIDFSEFVMTTLNKKNLHLDERLEAVFEIFDKDSNEYIDIDEIMNVLGKGKNLDDRVWKELIVEIDVNCDG